MRTIQNQIGSSLSRRDFIAISSLVMAFGDYVEPMEDLSEVMNFDLLVV